MLVSRLAKIENKALISISTILKFPALMSITPWFGGLREELCSMSQFYELKRLLMICKNEIK